MKHITAIILGLILVVGCTSPSSAQGFFDPTGVELETRELTAGVYALLSKDPLVDNSGFVVGERGVLVVDAHINGEMAGQIQGAVRRVTDKPILYLVNTNYHGDHTFGNYAFPATTTVVAHRKTRARMHDFEHEKRFMQKAALDDNAAVLDDVQLRLPDLVFDDYLRLDLGGRVVELHHFGPGNTPGDVVVYEPTAKVAFTGNLVLDETSVPGFSDGGVGEYLVTLSRFAQQLDVETIVPGHGALCTQDALSRYLHYLTDLIEETRRAIRAGKTLDAFREDRPLQTYLDGSGDDRGSRFWRSLHGLNLQVAYMELSDAG